MSVAGVNQELSNGRDDWDRDAADQHVKDPQAMRSLAETAARELENASAEEVVRWATDTFGSRICITSSMSDAVIMHLASAVSPSRRSAARRK